MDIQSPLALLGNISPQQFMRRYWQKKPLLVRGAVPDMVPPIARAELFDLAGQEGVESRLIQHGAKGWTLRQGPFGRRALPPATRPGWTLLVQGVDLHHAGIHALLRQFRFLPDARLDDLMISYASDQGGVGPHFDSYDVFLLQAAGRRRWSIGRQRDMRLQEGVPLKILENFEPEQSFVLEPGDMLYLPPRYAHDGVAEGGDCMTYSIGLRSPAKRHLGADLLARVAEAHAEELEHASPTSASHTHYRDPTQGAVTAPAAMPEALQAFAREAVALALREPDAIERALGESMTEPKANVWFDDDAHVPDEPWQRVALDRRTRMLYDARHIYINGESFRAGGRDATLMRRLADRRELQATDLRGASKDAIELMRDWCDAGWAHAE
ncbi:cupin domain-containing protein [Variovorax sp. OV329]|uniref:JmjC domain-containing protein n=1 Tax=Variovorax sp. OV329 TaxID=1882825 RepID=UPI0008F09296|nr:cupin domain-containing protein [Variovorax sp. OV329]SFN45695.1 50S ribosomal protein L16 3-hydroxylase [Variovorax sp. OV329]